MPDPVPSKRDEEIARLYAEGAGSRVLAARFGISTTRVFAILDRMGIPRWAASTRTHWCACGAPTVLHRKKCRDCMRARDRARKTSVRAAKDANTPLRIFEIRGLREAGPTAFYGAGTDRGGLGPYLDKLWAKPGVFAIEVYTAQGFLPERRPRRTLVETLQRAARRAA